MFGETLRFGKPIREVAGKALRFAKELLLALQQRLREAILQGAGSYLPRAGAKSRLTAVPGVRDTSRKLFRFLILSPPDARSGTRDDFES
jgi:hypothetical protein